VLPQRIMQLSSLPKGARNAWGARSEFTVLSFAFFLSGFAALIYQVVWQRMLFAAFGVDIESVTVIVSIFMLGLGIGGFAGGALADRYPMRIPVVFCLTELAIAVFGFFSVGLISIVAIETTGSSLAVTALTVFGLLGFPTFLMGATLPLLVAYATRDTDRIGVATGNLYFVNTLGAAFGALLTGFWFFHWLDLEQSARVGVGANLVSSLGLLLILFARKND
jgi:predicted membrane-bound spermidine synthase